MDGAPADVAAAELALERLFRLTMSRKMHNRQTAAVGASVTRAGFAVLRVLDDGGEVPIGEVARQCSMDPAVAGRQVRVLEDDGLVERSAADGDARVSVVRLTAAGRAAYRRLVGVRTEYMHAVLAGWTVADRTNLVRLVDRLVDDLTSTPFDPISAGRPGRARRDPAARGSVA